MLKLFYRFIFIIAASLLLFGCPNMGAPKTYDRIYIETYHPNSEFDPHTDTKLWLFDTVGTQLAESSGGSGIFDILDYTGGLQSGVYYIKVSGESVFAGTETYAIRIVSGAPPAPVRPGEVADAYEPDGGTNPWQGGAYKVIRLNEVIVRELETNSDIDWFRLVLL